MITASSLIALVEARGAKEATGQLLEVGAASDTAGTKLKSLAVGGLLVAGAAAIGVGVASAKMAGDFQQGTATLVTSAGLSRDSIGAVRQGILDLSVSTATSTDQLTKGMFNVQSALHLGAGGLQALKAAAEGARAENSDLAQTTDVLTTAMVNYHLAAAQAVPTMDSLIVTVADGKMHMDDLTGSLKNVLPVSAAFHIQLSDVEGALATMANAGDRGTAAGTHLAMMFKMLSSPTSTAAGEMKAMGIDSIKLAQTMQTSLPDALKMIQDAVSQHFAPGSVEYNRAIMAILGGSKSGIAGLELFGQGLKALGNNTNDAAAALRKGGKDVENWDVIQGNFNFKMQAAKDAVDAFMVTLGTKLLPVVGQVADAVTPLITGFSDWIGKSDGLSGAIDQVSSAFQQVFEPVKQVADAGKPLLDTFDRASALIPKTTEATKPLVDTFDRATAVIKNTTDSVNPLVSIFKDWKPVIEDVFKDVKILAGDVGTFASGIVSATDKSGLLQTDLQFLHDILPAVGTFLVNVGGDINANLLPPLESLITNVLRAEAGFVNWADKSGYAKAALSVLEGSIQLTTQILGPLIQAVSSVVGWLGGGGAGTDTLVFALSAAATAFTLLKIADTATQFGNFVSKLQEGDGVISNLALSVKDKLARAFDSFMSNQAPHLKASMDSVKVSAEEAAVAEEEVAAAPADTSAAGWFAKLETELGGVETQAAATGVAVAEVGTGAETTMSEGVAVGAAESEASLAGVGAAADAAKTQVASVGTTAETSAATGGTAIAGLNGGVVGLAIAIAFMASEWGYANTASKSFTDQFKSGDWLAGLASIAALATPGGMLGNLAYDFHRLTVEFGLTKDSSQDMSKQTTANIQNMAVNSIAPVNKMKNTIVDDATTMAKQVYAQTSYMSAKALANFQQLNGDLTDQMQSMDANIIGYWNAVSDYVENNPITGVVSWRSVGGPVTPGGPVGGTTHHFAAGTDYAPGGMALVAEDGMELIAGPRVGYLPQGSKVIPNNQLSHSMGSGWGGGSKQPVHIHVDVGSKELASVLVDDIMDLAARKVRIKHGRKVF